MINNKTVIGIVTARGGSKGLPGKNLRQLCGKPLIAWSIEQGLASKYIDHLIVSTDDEEIANVAQACGASVPFIRPPNLASDKATSISVILHAINFLSEMGDQYHLVVLLEPTSPLRETADIDGAIELCVNNGCETSVVGVAAVESAHPSFLFKIESGVLKSMTGEQPSGLRRQDLLQDYFYLEGSIYVSPVEKLRQENSFYHANTMPWIVERYKAVEIDELSDFIMAEGLMAAKIQGVL